MCTWSLYNSHNKLTCFSGQKSPLSIDARNKGPCIAYICIYNIDNHDVTILITMLCELNMPF